jgi:peptidoglycan hydrolase-like protein with peptidoglycan-binding domain
VAWLERQLAVAEGRHAPAGEDRIYGEAVERQVRAFQIASDIVPNGIAGPRTIMRLSGIAPDNRDPVLAVKGTR